MSAMIRLNQRTRIVLLVAFALLLSLSLRWAWLGNFGRVTAVRAYLAPISGTARAALVLRARDRLIASQVSRSCLRQSRSDDLAGAIQALDVCFVGGSKPLYVLTDRIDLSARDLALGGTSKVNRVEGDVASMFANGYLEARVFFPSERQSNVVASIGARRSGPPPAEIAVTIDGTIVGVGHLHDDGWQTLSIPFTISPGFHRVWIEFTNDHIDRSSGQDRNVYLRSIVIETE